MTPPFQDGLIQHEKITSHMNENDDLRFLQITNVTKLQSFAYASTSLDTFLDMPLLVRSGEHSIKRLFPRLKRLYIFTYCLGPKVPDYDDFYDLVHNFDLRIEIELMVRILVRKPEPTLGCAPPSAIDECINGAMILKDIIVDQSENLDMPALMHRVIDDIEAEWDPEAFQGRRWHLSTRPRYTTGIPYVSTLKREKVPLPNRQLKRLARLEALVKA